MADAFDFPVDHMTCRPQNDWLVKVGVNLPSKQYNQIDFGAAAARVAASLGGGVQEGPAGGNARRA